VSVARTNILQKEVVTYGLDDPVDGIHDIVTLVELANFLELDQNLIRVHVGCVFRHMVLDSDASTWNSSRAVCFVLCAHDRAHGKSSSGGVRGSKHWFCVCIFLVVYTFKASLQVLFECRGVAESAYENHFVNCGIRT
jgi:hypothetical protein